MGTSASPRAQGWGSQCHPLSTGSWMGTHSGAVLCVPPPRKLRCLDVGGLAVQSPGLLRILLEEMLPQCRVLGMEMEEGDPPEAPPELGQPPPPSVTAL